MFWLLPWYVLSLILAFCLFPLARLAFPALADQGWSLTKPFAVIMCGFLCWLPPMVIRSFPYSPLINVLTVLSLIAFSLYIASRQTHRIAILTFFRQQWQYVCLTEAIFAVAFFIIAWLRSYDPSMFGFERPMDQAFIAAYIRAEHLPVTDPWLAGYPINYYDFGHFLLANFARLLNTPTTMASNLGLSLTAGMAACALFGVATNLSAAIRHRNHDRVLYLVKYAPFGIVATVMAFVLSNIRAFAMWYHTLATMHISAITWLTHPHLWSSYDWYGPSRAIPYAITEFPNFSLLLGDPHANLLVFPFAILSMGVLLNLWQMPDARGIGIFGAHWRQVVPILGTAAMTLGSLYAINTWDLPTFLGMTFLVIALHQWRSLRGAPWREWWQGLIPLVCLGVVAYVLYLPFYLIFNPATQGFGLVPGTPNHLAIPLSASTNVVGSRTYIVDELGVNGLPIFIIVSWLLLFSLYYLLCSPSSLPSENAKAMRSEDRATDLPDDRLAPTLKRARVTAVPPPLRLPKTIWTAFGSVLVLTLVTVLTQYWEMWTFIWSLGIALVCCWFIIFCVRHRRHDEIVPLLVFIGAGMLIIAACEIVYFKDADDGTLLFRANTIFKFYNHVWLIFSIASACALASLVDMVSFVGRTIRKSWHWPVKIGAVAWGSVLVMLFLMCAIYPLGATSAEYLSKHPSPHSLDALVTLSSDDAAAIAWIDTNIQGSPVIVEGAEADKLDASYVFVSSLTGLPTLIGWMDGHETLWRHNWLYDPSHYADYYSRIDALKLIYTAPSSTEVLATLHQYHAEYVYLGPVERQLYGPQAGAQFDSYLQSVYQHGNVTLFKVP
jgi:YYY domain-containing protein